MFLPTRGDLRSEAFRYPDVVEGQPQRRGVRNGPGPGSPPVARLAPGGSSVGAVPGAVVEDPARWPTPCLGRAIGAGEDEGRVPEAAELRRKAPEVVRQPLDPPLLTLEILVLASLELPGLLKLVLEPSKLPTGNGVGVVLLWGEKERKGLGEDGFHASQHGNSPAKYSSVEANGLMDRPLPVGIPDIGPFRRTASGT
jgi:hypothetical protein